jgi:hypothetical protein
MSWRSDFAFFLEYFPTDLTLLDGVFKGRRGERRGRLREETSRAPRSTRSAEVETVISNGGAGTHEMRWSDTARSRR